MSSLPLRLNYAALGPAISKNAMAALPDPPGFKRSSPSSQKAVKSSADGMATLSTLRTRRAWEVAFSPAKSIPMQGFMMWMAGNSVQIFSMMSIFTCLKGALQGILNVNKTFAPLVVAPLPNASSSSIDAADVDALVPQKAVYVLCQAILLALALYKCQSMGLLPTSPSDWLAFKEPPIALEWSPPGAL